MVPDDVLLDWAGLKLPFLHAKPVGIAAPSEDARRTAVRKPAVADRLVALGSTAAAFAITSARQLGAAASAQKRAERRDLLEAAAALPARMLICVTVSPDNLQRHLRRLEHDERRALVASRIAIDQDVNHFVKDFPMLPNTKPISQPTGVRRYTQIFRGVSSEAKSNPDADQEWVIQLDIGNDGSIDRKTTTNSLGEYTFSNLVAGLYSVSEVQQGGWKQTYPIEMKHVINLGVGQSKADIDFGNHQACEVQGRKTGPHGDVGIGGIQIYADLNGNGQYDKPEPFLDYGLDGCPDEYEAGEGLCNDIPDPLLYFEDTNNDNSTTEKDCSYNNNLTDLISHNSNQTAFSDINGNSISDYIR